MPTIELPARKSRTELRRMTKANLLAWATEQCLLEHLEPEQVQGFTKAELVEELDVAQLSMEVHAEQAVGAGAADQVVQAKAAKKAPAPDEPLTCLLPIGKDATCGADGGRGGSYGHPLCQKHYDEWRQPIKAGEMDADEARTWLANRWKADAKK